MQYYFAPLEGLTDCAYRTLHHRFFPGVDRYYTPFFSPTVHRMLTPREARELPPADSLGVTVIPQLLTKVADDFNWMAQQCADLGYGEVNLNLGCPSGTVTAKGKGSGMLRELDSLDAFLAGIFRSPVTAVSIKTRIGFTDPQEWTAILSILNRYPVKELIVHPRVRSDFYKGPIHMEAFQYALENSRAPLCYNGDLCSLSQIQAFGKQFPQVGTVMIGRGLIADPGMLSSGGSAPEQLEQFYNALFDSYLHTFGSARNTMFRMKEHWGMLQRNFPGGEKLFKALRKTTDQAEFQSLTKQILHTVPFVNP